MSEVHFFNGHNGDRYCLDVNSSAVFFVDKVMEDVIKKVSPNILRSKYDTETINEAIDNFNSFKQEGFFGKNNKRILFSPETNSVELLGASLMISNACNLSCVYCFNNGGTLPTDSHTPMTFEVAKDAINFLVENSEGEVGCDFFGGEPLFSWPLIKEVVKYCKTTGRDWTYSMITNGTIMNDDILDLMSQYKFHIVVSYDSVLQDVQRASMTGRSTRELIRKNIRMLTSRLPRGEVSIRCIVTHHTIPYIKDIINEAKELGVRLLFGPVALPSSNPLNLTKDDYLQFINTITEVLKEEWELGNIQNVAGITSISNTILHAMTGKQRYFSCGIGYDIIGISSTGDIFPCHRFFGMSEYQMGSIYTGIDMKAYENYASRYVDNTEGCSICWARYFCGGGCAHESVAYESNALVPATTRCDLIRDEIELGLKFYADALNHGKTSQLDALKTTLLCHNSD